MATNKQDALARAYATLSSLRKNIAQMPNNIPEKYVREYHTVLDRLEDNGYNVSNFRIPNSEITPIVQSIQSLTFDNRPSGPTYSKEKYVDKPYLLTKIDAILGYFEIITAEKPKKMGFSTPQD